MKALGKASLNPETLTSMLRHGGATSDSTVTHVETAAIGAGLIGDTYRCELTYDRAEPRAPGSLVAKVTSASEVSRRTGLVRRAYEREIRFYQHLADTLPLRTPHCFFADIDVTDGDFVLLLEDLTPASSVDQFSGFTADHADTALAALGGLHAPHWGSGFLRELDWLHGVRATMYVESARLMPTRVDPFVERFGDRLEPEWIELIRRFQPHMTRFLVEQPGPWSVQHADLRPDNMLFDAKAGAEPLVVLDWQSVSHGPPLVDAAYLLGTSLDTELRRKHERDLLHTYHEGLLAQGVTGYSWDDCWRDYRRYSYHALCSSINISGMVKQTERGDRMFLTMLRRTCAQIADLEADRLIDRDGVSTERNHP
ncbi:phosphotransferase [Streptomyces fuscichromogenes]|uniref:phosphotransferase n=1 Tax=Streptomyces fuscichromogenes TaxID=1324013 RepID=UPI00381AC923